MGDIYYSVQVSVLSMWACEGMSDTGAVQYHQEPLDVSKIQLYFSIKAKIVLIQKSILTCLFLQLLTILLWYATLCIRPMFGAINHSTQYLLRGLILN